MSKPARRQQKTARYRRPQKTAHQHGPRFARHHAKQSAQERSERVGLAHSQPFPQGHPQHDKRSFTDKDRRIVGFVVGMTVVPYIAADLLFVITRTDYWSVHAMTRFMFYGMGLIFGLLIILIFAKNKNGRGFAAVILAAWIVAESWVGLFAFAAFQFTEKQEASAVIESISPKSCGKGDRKKWTIYLPKSGVRYTECSATAYKIHLDTAHIRLLVQQNRWATRVQVPFK